MPRLPATYKLQFFSSEQNELLDRLTEIIIPSDDRSPGASAAKVSLFIDLIVFHSDRVVRKPWIDGLEAVGNEGKRRFRRPFLKCSAERQDQILADMAANEERPRTELELFFKRLKSMTIDGYYTSRIGIHEELRYKGNTPLAEFIGCTHPEHGG